MTDIQELATNNVLSTQEANALLKSLRAENDKLRENIQEQHRQAEANLYHYLDLYQKISSEKVIAEDQAQQFIKIVEELKKEKESFRKLSSVVSTQFEMAIKSAIQKLEKDVGETVGRVATEKTAVCVERASQCIEELKATLEASKERIHEYENKILTKWWKDLLSAALVSLAVSGALCIAIVKWLT